MDTGQETLSLKGNAPGLVGGAFSPDCRRLAGGGTKLTVWDVETGREALSLKGPVNGVTDVAFSADGNHIVASGAEAVKVWNATPLPAAPAMKPPGEAGHDPALPEPLAGGLLRLTRLLSCQA